MYEAMIRELLALDPIEQIAQELHARTGDYMSRAIYVKLREKTWPKGTPEKAMFDDGKGVRLYKIPRYVELPDRAHEYVECIYVVEGQLEHKINGVWYTCEKGSFCYVPTHNEHSVRLGEDSLCFVIDIVPEVFQSLHLPNRAIQSYPMLYPTEQDESLRTLILQMWEHQMRDPALYAKVVYHLFYAMSFYLVQRYRSDIRLLTAGVFQNPVSYDLLHTIMENYRTITLSELADTYHFSVPYLSTLIHKEFGQTFSALLRSYRLMKAEELLLETTKQVDTIGKEVGFREAAQFIRAFKSVYGMTPARYRTEHKKEKEFIN